MQGVAVIDGESHGFNLGGKTATKMFKSLRSRSCKRRRPVTSSTQTALEKSAVPDVLKDKIRALKESKRVSHTYLSSNRSTSKLQNMLDEFK